MQSTQQNHQAIIRARTEYSTELAGYKGLVKMRKEKIEELEDKISDLNGNLKKALSAHVATDDVLHQARLEYRKLFDEK